MQSSEGATQAIDMGITLNLWNICGSVVNFVAYHAQKNRLSLYPTPHRGRGIMSMCICL